MKRITDTTQTTRFRFWLWLVRVIGVIVPRRLRANWRREWEAELRHREELLAEWDRLDWGAKLDLLRRSASAFWDAAWLQPKRLEDEMFQDLRFGLRMLRTSKMLTLVAVLSLGLGIGATSTVYALIDQLLIHDVTAREPERLVRLSSRWNSYPNYRDIRESGVFEELAAGSECYPPLRWRAGDRTSEIIASCVSANDFQVMGAQAALGRAFTSDEAAAEKDPRVVVISHNFWKRRLGGVPDVIGKEITLNSTTFTIIGALPANYRAIEGVGSSPEVYVPFNTALFPRLFDRRNSMLPLIIGRLAPGRTRVQTQEALWATLNELGDRFPEQANRKQSPPPVLTPVAGLAKHGEISMFTTISVALSLVAAVVLLIACANVAGLLLARGIARRHEIAIRLAVGATPANVMWLILREGLTLVAIGAVIGIACSIALNRMLIGFLAAGVSLLDPLAFAAMLVTMLVTATASVYFPARRAAKVDPLLALHHD